MLAHPFALVLLACLPLLPGGEGATISGRVTLDGKPAAGVAVEAIASELDRGPSAVTDAEGRYTTPALAIGHYRVRAWALGLVDESGLASRGRDVNVTGDDPVAGVDFALRKGGVVTGRVVDRDGRPAIGQRVSLEAPPGSATGQERDMSAESDDRGVYRIFGVNPGRYVVGVGGGERFGGSHELELFRRAYHPAAASAAAAVAVEVAFGSEVTGVDIVVDRAPKPVSLRGRVVDAVTGGPIAGVQVFVTQLEGGGNSSMSGPANGLSDDAGRFTVEGVTPGSYVLSADARARTSSYVTDLTRVTVADKDLADVIVTMQPGATISGTVVLEGSPDASAASAISRLRLVGLEDRESDEIRMGGPSATVGPDGTFIMRGIAAGRVRLILNSWRAPKGFVLKRVERDGVEVSDVEVAAGEAIAGVRVVVAYGTATIRGTVSVVKGRLPEGVGFTVYYRVAGNGDSIFAEVDGDGSSTFLIPDLAAGEYELMVRPRPLRPSVSVPDLEPGRTTVRVGASGTTDAVVALDASRYREERP